jgi:hypothetical protein
VIAAGDVTDFGERRNLHLAAGAAHILAERLMRARRLWRSQAKSANKTNTTKQNINKITRYPA